MLIKNNGCRACHNGKHVISNFGEKKYIKVQVPFSEELSGIGVTKLLLNQLIYTVAVKYVRNQAVIELANDRMPILEIKKGVAMGTLDIRSLGYYKVNQNVLTRELSKRYQFNTLPTMMANQQESLNRMQGQVSNNENYRDSHPQEKNRNQDSYPWLEADDERREMSDEEILHKYIDLRQSTLTKREKLRLMRLLCKYKKAFSLRDEIGACPNFTIDIEVIDKTPFFVRPFPIKETDKPIMDKQMNRLVALGILSKNSTSHTSPVMLITRKFTADKRPVVDFRLLNTRIMRRNIATPLMRDIVSILGNSHCEVFSCLDLKDAYHSIPLNKEAKEYCGIMPYFGSPHYRYEVLPMGLSISPAKWMEYVELLMEDLSDRKHYIAIMDDLLLHSSYAEHFQQLEDLFRSLIKHGLKLSPKKCQLFREELVYMGNVFRIEDGKVAIEVLKTRIEDILKVPTPENATAAKAFVGMVTFITRHVPELQKLLDPIHQASIKDRPFVWTELHQTNFEILKDRISKCPICFCPTAEGRYKLYSDTSRKHVGNCLWQRQEGTDRLIGFGSKTLQPAALNYSVTELEMQGMLLSMVNWSFYLDKNEFDCAVDHKAIVQIMKSKKPPASERIKRFLRDLAEFAVDYYYIKGKDMVISDYLSRTPCDINVSAELIPVGFDPTEILKMHEEWKYKQQGKLTVVTRSQTKTDGVKPPEVHGIDKGVDPDLKPEHQDRSKLQPVQDALRSKRQALQDKYSTKPKTTASQSTARKILTKSIRQLRSKSKSPEKVIQEEITHEIPDIWEPGDIPLDNAADQATREIEQIPQNTPVARGIPDMPNDFGPPVDDDQMAEPGLLKPRQLADLDPTGNLELDLNSPYTVEEVETKCRPPTKMDFEVPPSLADQMDEGKFITRYLPKQVDVERLLKELNRKVLRQTHLPVTMRDMQAAYLNSPHFRDIYICLAQNRMPVSTRKARRIEAMVNNYMLLDTLLFKVEMNANQEPNPKLCIPISKVDMLLQHYHSSMVAGHAGVTKTYMTINDRFHCPGLADHVRAYITGCHVCQMFKRGKAFTRPYQKRININTPAFSRVSMDIKHMPGTRYRFILVLLCEVSNYMVVYPLRTTQSHEVCSALLNGYIKYFGPPAYLICDKDPAFLSSLTEYMAQQMDIKIITVSPTNHKSLQAEHGIKSLSNILMKHLSGMGSNWPEYLGMAMLSYNSYTSPNLAGHSPYELALGNKVRLAPAMEVTPEIPVSGSFKDYLGALKKQLTYLRTNLAKFRDVRMDLLNKDREMHSYHAGDLVYVYMPRGAMLQSGSRKIACHFVGPLVVYRAVSPNQFFLMSLDGIVYPHLIEETRLKPGKIYTSSGNVTNLADLKQVLRTRISTKELKASPLQQ